MMLIQAKYEAKAQIIYHHHHSLQRLKNLITTIQEEGTGALEKT